MIAALAGRGAGRARPARNAVPARVLAKRSIADHPSVRVVPVWGATVLFCCQAPSFPRTPGDGSRAAPTRAVREAEARVGVLHIYKRRKPPKCEGLFFTIGQLFFGLAGFG